MPKRIIIFSTAYFPLVGGAEVAIKEITDRMPDWQFEMVTAQIKPDLPKTEKIGNVNVHRCGFGKPIDKHLLPFIGAWRALSLTRKDVKDVQDVKDDLIWSMMASYGGFAALVYTWFRPKTKFLLTLQEGDPPEYIIKRVRPFGYFFKQIFVRADAIQAISKFLADWGVSMGFKGAPVIVPNGVDIARFTKRISPEERKALRQKLGFADSDVVLVTASRLVLKNGTEHLIRSLIDLPENFKVLVVGDGDDRQKLEALVEQNSLKSRVVFLGMRGHDELPGLMQASDIFCRPSLSEGLGNAFLEAMGAGLPVIATPVGGIPDFLFDGETGVYCRPSDPESIAQAALRIQNEPGLRQKLIERGGQMVTDRYAWDNIAVEMRNVFEKLNT